MMTMFENRMYSQLLVPKSTPQITVWHDFSMPCRMIVMLLSFLKQAVFGECSAMGGLIAACLLVFISCPANAQCSGVGPWSTCPTWPGPLRSQVETGSIYQYAWSALDDIDLNGDGLRDFAQLYGSEPGITLSTGSGFATQSFTAAWNCYSGNFDGSGRTSVACPSAGNIAYATSNGSALNSFTNIAVASGNIWSSRFIVNADNLAPYPINPCIVMDVDGDGTDDLVCGGAGGPINPQLNPYPSHTPTSIQWGVYLSTGTGFTYKTWAGPAGAYSYGFACVPGEFDGDGMQDLACNFGGSGGSHTTSWLILHSTGIGWQPETWSNGPTGPVEQATYSDGCTFVTNSVGVCPVSCVPGDFNGDGLGDISCDNGNNTWTIGFAGTSSAFMSVATWNGQSVNTLLLPLASLFSITSDIYGVGRTGILLNFAAGSSNWTYLAPTFAQPGGSFTQTTFSTPFPVGASTGQYDQMTMTSGCIVTDLNGDGIKDLACVQATGSGTGGTGTWNVGLSSRPN